MAEIKKQKSITLKLEGNKITSDKLRNSIGSFYGFVDEVASQVFGIRRPIKWIVSAKEGSIVLVSEPDVEQRLDSVKKDKVFALIKGGINILEKEAKYPPFFNDRALEYLQNLASIPSGGNGLSNIEIFIDEQKQILSKHIVANVDNILGIHSKALGSIEGRLQTLSERGSQRFIVYDVLTDKGIPCYINDELMNEAMKAFSKRVYVYGLINYDNRGNPKSIKVEELKIFRDKVELPSAYDVCGIL